MLPDHDDLDATAMAELVMRGDVHPRELVDAAIERSEARNPALNAIIHTQFERARADAEHVDTTAPFAGVPFVFKDYKGREAGEPTTPACARSANSTTGREPTAGSRFACVPAD